MPNRRCGRRVRGWPQRGDAKDFVTILANLFRLTNRHFERSSRYRSSLFIARYFLNFRYLDGWTAGKYAGKLNPVRNCFTWYSGYLASIRRSAVLWSPLLMASAKSRK